MTRASWCEAAMRGVCVLEMAAGRRVEATREDPNGEWKVGHQGAPKGVR